MVMTRIISDVNALNGVVTRQVHQCAVNDLDVRRVVITPFVLDGAGMAAADSCLTHYDVTVEAERVGKATYDG